MSTSFDVSVVIPCYNKANFIAETVGSVLTQSVMPKQLIIVDDGSTDESAAIIDELLKLSPLIEVIHQENSGVSAARNAGIARATGRYITVLDADDIMAHNYLAVVRDAVEQTGSNLVTCAVELFGAEHGDWTPEEYDPYTQRYRNLIPTLASYERAVWQRVGGYRTALPFNEDWDFFIRCEDVPLQVAMSPDKLLRYRVDPNGLASRYIKDTWHQSVSLMMVANESKYPVTKILAASRTLEQMTPQWALAFAKQREHYPSEWLLSYLCALPLLTIDVLQARTLLEEAVELSHRKQWLPLLTLAQLAVDQGDRATAYDCLFWVRILRPDTEVTVLELLQRLKT